ncbi:MAG TPA: NAD(P)H-binding protein [Verrucomicrobiae bacterium]|nr:NAD(P)H-binding protein [Verrucomicrobiae bacterium]
MAAGRPVPFAPAGSEAPLTLVAGAAGFVGRHVLQRLHAEGRGPLRAGVRTPGGFSHPAGVVVVRLDLDDEASLATAVAGVATVVHCAAVTADRSPPGRDGYARVNAGGTDRLLAACCRAGVSRVVLVSGLGTRPAPPPTYMATRWAMEEAVRHAGLAHVILQPSVLFGVGAPFFAALDALVRRLPVVPMIGNGRLRFQPLWVEDLARCVALAAGADPVGGPTVALGGADIVTMREILIALARAAGRPARLASVPLPLARLQARLLALILAHPPLTPAALELFTVDNVAGSGALARAFGFDPVGWLDFVAPRATPGEEPPLRP